MRQTISLSLVFVILSSAFVACSSGGGEELPDRLRVMTYNAGLATGYVDYAAERARPVADALAEAALELDILCVQEIWSAADFDTLWGSINGELGKRYRLAFMPESDCPSPACTTEELEPLQACVDLNCANVSTEELDNCALEFCTDDLSATKACCQACLAGAIGSPLDEILALCTTSSAGYAYEGSFGTALLSRLPLLDQERLLFGSQINRRALLYSRVQTQAFGDVHVFCTHLSANLSTVPYPGIGSWAEEQRTQINGSLAYMTDKAKGQPVLLLGDLNAGPAGNGYIAELPANYDAIMAKLDQSVYAESAAPTCTFCDDNPLVGGEPGTSVLIDHIMTKDFAATTEVERTLDQPTTIQAGGQSVTTRLSDHYGVKATFIKPGI